MNPPIVCPHKSHGLASRRQTEYARPAKAWVVTRSTDRGEPKTLGGRVPPACPLSPPQPHPHTDLLGLRTSLDSVTWSFCGRYSDTEGEERNKEEEETKESAYRERIANKRNTMHGLSTNRFFFGWNCCTPLVCFVYLCFYLNIKLLLQSASCAFVFFATVSRHFLSSIH